MDPHQEDQDDAEACHIGDDLPKIFPEDLQYPSYDDDVELSTQTAMPNIACWTPFSPLQAPTVSDRAGSSLDSLGPVDNKPNLDPFGFTPIDSGVEHATLDEASRSTQEGIQENRPEDEIFSLINFDPDQTSVDPVEHQVFPLHAAQDDMLGLSGPDANLSTTTFFNSDWFEASTPFGTAGCPQTANATTEELPSESWSLTSNMAPPAADLDRAPNPAWMALLADSGPSSEATISATPTGTINPDPAEKTPHASSVLLPPSQIAPNVRNHQRHPLHQTAHGTYAPILPRESSSTNSLVAGHQQDPPCPSDASLKTAPEPHAQASAINGRKRGPRNAQRIDVPASYLCEFDLSKSVGLGEEEQQLSKPQKRRKRDTGKVERSCLRCKFHRIKCSETLPCAPCLELFHRRANKHSDLAVQLGPWTFCIDTDLSKLNFFHQLATLHNDIVHALGESCSVYKSTTAPSLDQYLQRVRPHAGDLMRAVEEEMDGNSMFHHLLGSQTQEPLHQPHGLSYKGKNPSSAWIFAATMLTPDYIVAAAKLSEREMGDFLIKISAVFFASTMEMLKDAKPKSMENWLILNERLETIKSLIVYPGTIRPRLARKVLQLLRRASVTMHETPKGKDSDVFLAVNDPSGRYEAVDNKSGWEHLRQFTVHWLTKLQRGSTAHREIKIMQLRLNELHMLAILTRGRDKKECEDAPDSEPDNSMGKLADRAFDTFENLRGQVPMDKAAVTEKLIASYQGGPCLYELPRLLKELMSTSQSIQDTDQACKIIHLPKHMADASICLDRGRYPTQFDILLQRSMSGEP